MHQGSFKVAGYQAVSLRIPSEVWDWLIHWKVKVSRRSWENGRDTG
jgi:hypothetical protein